MPTYAFAGRTRSGQPITGERTAQSQEAAIAQLRREQILVSKVEQVKAKSEGGFAVRLAAQRFSDASSRLPLLHAIQNVVDGQGSPLQELMAAALPRMIV